MVGLTIRPVLAAEDYSSLASVWDAITPREPFDVGLARTRAERDNRRTYLLAEREGGVAACGFAGPSQSDGRGFVSVRVLPRARGAGVGSELLVRLCRHLHELGFATVSAHVDGNQPRDIAFAERHGFTVADRQVEQVRVIGNEPAAPVPEGLRFVSVAEQPDLLRAAFPLAERGYADLATTYAVTVSLDEWLEEEATIPGASIVALAGDEIVGYTGMTGSVEEGAADGLTVVRRDWRGRGVAKALKRYKLAQSAALGLSVVSTWTQVGNDVMRAVNERIGYTYRDIVLSVRRDLPFA